MSGRDDELRDVLSALDALTRNGELRDYDDELANRIEDAKAIVSAQAALKDQRDDWRNAYSAEAVHREQANERIAAAEERARVLEAERDSARERIGHWQQKNLAAEAQVESLTQRVAELEGALRPFAEFAADKVWRGTPWAYKEPCTAVLHSHATGLEIARSDFDRAASLLTPEEAARG